MPLSGGRRLARIREVGLRPGGGEFGLGLELLVAGGGVVVLGGRQVLALAVGAGIGLEGPWSFSGSGTSGSVTVMRPGMPSRRPGNTGRRVTNVLRISVQSLAALADPIRREVVDLLAAASWPPGNSPAGFR